MNENSYWSGGRNGGTINNKGDKSFDNENGPEVAENGFGGYQPIGDFIVDFGMPVQRGSLKRELCLDKGLVCSSGKRKDITIKSSAFSSYPQQIMVLHYVADKTGGLNANFLFVSQHNNDKLKTDGHSLRLNGRLGNGLTCSAIAKIYPHGGNLKQLDGYLRLERADSCTIIIAIETNYIMDYHKGFRGKDSDTKVERRIQSIKNLSYAALYHNHIADYQSLFNRQSLVLDSPSSYLESLPTDERLAIYKQNPSDPGLENTIFNFGRYLMISSSRPGSLPAGLQGICCISGNTLLSQMIPLIYGKRLIL